MEKAKTVKRMVERDGCFYRVKSDKIEIPDFSKMSSIGVSLWMVKHTYPRGYSKPNPLAGLAGVISINS